MAFNPKTNWQYNEIVKEDDLNRIEQGIADADTAASEAQDNVDAHKAAAVLDHPDGSVTTAKLAEKAVSAAKLSDGAATDTVIGDRNINDTITAEAGADKPARLWSKLANMIKRITGKANWFTAPSIDLETVSGRLNQNVSTTASPTFVSASLTAAPGTAPLIVSSSTAVANLNADLLDGQHGSYYASVANVDGRFGAGGTVGVTDWNDATNTKPGTAPTLLLGSATNGMGGANYFHALNFEYQTKNGTGNITQLGVPYGDMNDKSIYLRGRYNNTWSSWYKVWTSGNMGAGSTMDADAVDGFHATNSVTANTLVVRDGAGDINIRRGYFGMAQGTAPFTVASTTVVANLNADFLDGFHASSFAKLYSGSTSTPNVAYAPGTYMVVPPATGSPEDNYGLLEVTTNDGTTYNGTAGWCFQRFRSAITGKEYRRQKIDTSEWTAWVETVMAASSPTLASLITTGFLTVGGGFYASAGFTSADNAFFVKNAQFQKGGDDGSAPFEVLSPGKVTNLNADSVDGFHMNQDLRTTASPTFAGINLPAPTVIAPTLLNGWTNYGGAYQAAGYYKDSMGHVHLVGEVKSGSGGPVFTLPAGYRPAKAREFSVSSNNGTAYVQGVVTVTAAGDVNMNTGSNLALSLEGISFRAEA